MKEALAEKQRLAAEADALRECLANTSCGPALRGQQQAAAQQAALQQAAHAPAVAAAAAQHTQSLPVRPGVLSRPCKARGKGPRGGQ